MANDQTVAERGAETVHQYVDGDTKANFSFFATITAQGAKLPLILLTQGKTQRCRGQFRTRDGYEHEIWHSPTGWYSVPLTHDYLHPLCIRIPHEPICLVMDQFAAHTADSVVTEAEAPGIEIIWVPKGATGRYQPLDWRTFGALKSKGKTKWKFMFSQHCGVKCDRRIGAELLLQSWEELSESAVAAGWDFGEPDEDEESESGSSHDEFELAVDQNLSDDDVSEITEAAEEDEADSENQQVKELGPSRYVFLVKIRVEARKVRNSQKLIKLRR
jgi:hypothetical protein